MSYLFTICASLLFGLVPTVQSFALNTGLSAENLLLVSGLTGVVCAFTLCQIKHVSLKISKKQIVAYLLLGAIGIYMTDYLLSTAYTYIPVGLTTLIHFTYPTITRIGEIIFFKEKTTLPKIISIILSFIGLALLFDSDTSISIIGILIAIASAFCYSFFLLMSNNETFKDDHEFKMNFYLNIISTTMSLIMSLKSIDSLSFTTYQLTFSMLSGLMLCFGNILINISVSKLGSGDTAFICMLEPITSLIVSTVIYHYAFGLKNILAIIFIISALLPIIFQSKKSEN